MSARGFTIFELLVVLAITTLLAGIVLPIGLSRLAADRFTQTQSQLASAIIIARADAQRRGVIVRLIAVQDERGTALWSEELEDAEPAKRDSAGERGAARRSFVLDLPAGTAFERVPVVEDDGAGSASGVPPDGDEDGGATESGEESRAQEFTLCVLMPDGAVAPGQGVLLVSGERAVRVRLNMWTGDATFEPFRREDAEEEADAPPVPGGTGPETGGEP